MSTSSDRIIPSSDSYKFLTAAIIAHVDHGKTTMMDAILRQSQVFRENEEVRDCIMDSDSIERERGITIYAKVSRVLYKDFTIHIIDTPGHADFSAEVERILSICDVVLLLVDAIDGVMPQTKYVLSKAIEANKKVIVILNKIDRPGSRIDEVVEEIMGLFIDLGADDQIDFPVLYASGKEGWCVNNADDPRVDMVPLFDAIITHAKPDASYDPEGPFKMLVTLLEYNEHFGRILIGKIFSGSIKMNDKVKSINLKQEEIESVRVTKIITYNGIKKQLDEHASCGSIIAVAGFKNTSVADTICDLSVNDPIYSTPISPPVISITIGVNTSPLAGREGDKVTSRMIQDRLNKEAESNVAITIKESESKDSFEVFGRGELQLAILAENMRREGYELSISRPKPLLKKDPDTGKILEPVETVYIDVDTEYAGSVVNELNVRKGTMVDMLPFGTGKNRIVYEIPSRCFMGYYSKFLTDTRGEGVMNRVFKGYYEFCGPYSGRKTGSLISSEDGESSGYALWKLQDRGRMFIGPGEPIYVGMIIGEHNKENDLEVNAARAKQLSNMRASGSDEKIVLTPAKKVTIEEFLSYIEDDELIEVTPKNLRLRKKLLDPNQRKRQKN